MISCNFGGLSYIAKRFPKIYKHQLFNSPLVVNTLKKNLGWNWGDTLVK